MLNGTLICHCISAESAVLLEQITYFVSAKVGVSTYMKFYSQKVNFAGVAKLYKSATNWQRYQGSCKVCVGHFLKNTLVTTTVMLSKLCT